jgi:hypothetical protein
MNGMFPFVVFDYSLQKNREQHLNYIKMTYEKMEDQNNYFLEFLFKTYLIHACEI